MSRLLFERTSSRRPASVKYYLLDQNLKNNEKLEFVVLKTYALVFNYLDFCVHGCIIIHFKNN